MPQVKNKLILFLSSFVLIHCDSGEIKYNEETLVDFFTREAVSVFKT